MATITCANASQSVVQATIDSPSVHDGDTVVIPSTLGNVGGISTWNAPVVVSKGITLQGTGLNSTVITRTTTANTSLNTHAIRIQNTGSKFVRISGLRINNAVNSPYNSSWYVGAIYAQGPVLQFRIDNCYLNGGRYSFSSNDSIVGSGNGPVYGVIDHCVIHNPTHPHSMFDDRVGDASVATADGQTALSNAYTGYIAWKEFLSDPNSYPGSTKMVVYEDCQFLWDDGVAALTNAQGMIDGRDGGKVCIRYSTTAGIDCVEHHHGAYGSQGCSGLYFESYYNVFDGQNGRNNVQGSAVIYRGGKHIEHDNQWINYSFGPGINLWLEWPPTVIGQPVAYQAIHDSYFWNNTWNGTSFTNVTITGLNGATQQQANDSIHLNRDYFLNSPPITQTAGQLFFNYKPLAYPHPFISGPTGAVISISPASLKFPSTAVGQSAQSQTINVTNIGIDTLNWTASLTTNPNSAFSISPASGTAPSQVSVGYSPTVKANDSGTLTFSGGGGASAQLSGIAYPIEPGLSFPASSGIVTAPFTVQGGAVSQSVSTTTVASGGRVSFGVNIATAGNYFITAFVIAPDDGSNSFYVNFDTEPTDPDMIWDISPVGPNPQTRPVIWRSDPNSPHVWSLGAGLHELIFRGRESNAQLLSITVVPNAPVIPPAPAAPTTPSPANNATDVSINADLSWAESTSNCLFNVYLGTTNPPPQVASALTSASYSPTPVLTNGTTYYWKVTAYQNWSSNGQNGVVSTDGPIWSFQTAPIIIPPNQPPQSHLTSNKTSGVGPLTVTFTLTSSDSDGTVASGVWDTDDGAPENISTPAASITRSHTYPASSGTTTSYSPSWTVTDDDGLSSTPAIGTISVSPTPVNQPPQAGISVSPTAGFGPFQATFTLTSNDPDGTVASGVIDYGDGSATETVLTPAASFSKTHPYAAVLVDTTRTATWQVTDSNGATSPLVTKDVLVKAAVIPPTVVLTAPAEGTIYSDAPVTVSFAAVAAQGTNPIDKVEFYQGATLVGTDTTSPYSFNWTNVAAGDYTLKAIAYDNQGTPLTGTSPLIHIHVLATGMAVVPQIIFVQEP